MTKFAPESFNENRSESAASSSSLSESVNSNMTLDDVKTILTKKIPADVCIRDRDGYIACGPIVGSPRPENPSSGFIIEPVKPQYPIIEKLPPLNEIPDSSAKPLKPTYELFDMLRSRTK